MVIFIIAFTGCKEEYPFEVTPRITLNEISSYNVQELKDPITFSINYTDGDGDLGENSTGTKNLYLIDNRINIEYTYRIQELVPGDDAVPIKGNLSFSIPNTFLTGNDSTETVTYSIHVIDRAGNKSNQIVAGPITVYK